MPKKSANVEKEISIHVPRVEDDIIGLLSKRYLSNFNPRPPCGGRRIGQRHSTIIKNFNPRPPCGGRRTAVVAVLPRCRFQSTSPVWRTTRSDKVVVLITVISIHVPRVEDDVCKGQQIMDKTNFNPRPPCGGRPTTTIDADGNKVFQSTSPVWRTTAISSIIGYIYGISIHVPRVEDDIITAKPP